MHYPRPTQMETDDAGSLISISDMMAGLLFIFIITLAAFIIRFQAETDNYEEAKGSYDDVVEELTNSNKQRRTLLEKIKNELEERGIRVEVDDEHGVLRLKESAIKFGVGQATLAPEGQSNLQVIGEIMAMVIPCYTEVGEEQRNFLGCEESATARLDSILLEGHTDNIPINNNDFKDNWELSTQRAIETYKLLRDAEPEMLALSNPSGQVLFSVSGYGDGRPVIQHLVPTPEEGNRRIDFRFIMAPPRVVAPQQTLEESGVR